MNTVTESWVEIAPKMFDVSKIPSGWGFFVESSGGWCWSCEGVAVYATPFWEGIPGVPVDAFDDEDEEKSCKS